MSAGGCPRSSIEFPSRGPRTLTGGVALECEGTIDLFRLYKSVHSTVWIFFTTAAASSSLSCSCKFLEICTRRNFAVAIGADDVHPLLEFCRQQGFVFALFSWYDSTICSRSRWCYIACLSSWLIPDTPITTYLHGKGISLHTCGNYWSSNK